MRTIYRDVKTVDGREVIVRECDCDVARRERLAGKEAHKAIKDARDHGAFDNTGFVCTKTAMTVTI